jgi:hypothetical protein
MRGLSPDETYELRFAAATEGNDPADDSDLLDETPERIVICDKLVARGLLTLHKVEWQEPDPEDDDYVFKCSELEYRVTKLGRIALALSAIAL